MKIVLRIFCASLHTKLAAYSRPILCMSHRVQSRTRNFSMCACNVVRVFFFAFFYSQFLWIYQFDFFVVLVSIWFSFITLGNCWFTLNDLLDSFHKCNIRMSNYFYDKTTGFSEEKIIPFIRPFLGVSSQQSTLSHFTIRRKMLFNVSVS